MTTITIRWEADDGYAGGSRPHSLKLDVEELGMTLEEFCKLSTEEQIDAVADYIEDDFRSKVTWFVQKIDVPRAA